MKQLKQFLKRLRSRKPRRQDKHGSSMAMVMIITSALVIWVMCLAPLMATTGTTALKVQNGYTDYIGSRSAIEYAKSELVKIVTIDGKTPYTFAVVQQDNGNYMAVAKDQDLTTYQKYVANNRKTAEDGSIDDSLDRPMTNAYGNQVVAICYSTHIGISYDIVIDTYIRGTKSLTIRVPYSHQTELLIYPEAYRQTEALPLSDYVLVEGKMGGRWVWNTLSQESDKGENYEYEHLLPWITLDEQERLPNYANSTKYPAVFKYPVAASAGLAGGDVVEKLDTTPKNWVMPKASTFDEIGSIKMIGNAEGFQIYDDNGWRNLSADEYTVYYNGSTTFPTKLGKYTVTVDYKGTNEGVYTEPTDDNENPVNILPCNGMVMGDITIGKYGTESQDAPSKLVLKEHSVYRVVEDKQEKTYVKFTLEAQEKNEDVITDRVVYGYSTGSSDKIVWSDSNVFDKLSLDETYYFYCYIHAYIDDQNTYHTTSPVTVGEKPLHIYSAKNTLDSSSDKDGVFYLMNKNGVAANSGLQASSIGTVVSDEGYFYVNGQLPTGNNYNWKLGYSNGWTIRSQAKSGNSNYLTFQQSGGINNLPEAQKGDHRYPEYSYSVTLSNSQSLTVNSNGISYTINEKEYYGAEKKSSGCGGTSTWYEWEECTQHKRPHTEYLLISDNKVSHAAASSADTTIYFVKVPTVEHTALSAEKAAEQIHIPFRTLESFRVGYGTDVLAEVQTVLGEGVTITALTANSSIDVTQEALVPGTYMLRGTIDDNGTAKELVPFQVTVEKGFLTGSLSVTAEKNGNLDHEMKATGRRWHGEDGGIRYFGFSFNGETYWDYSTSTAEECDVIFLVDYQVPYTVWVEESGTWGFNGTASSAVPYSITATPVNSDNWLPTDFVFSFDEEGNVRWHAIPDDITVDMITNLVYRFEDPATGEVTEWTTDSTKEYNAYGVTISGSAHEEIENAFKIGPSIGGINVNGHCASMVKGSSLYFMGGMEPSNSGITVTKGISMDTFGNSVFLYTDLLVLNYDIVGGGQVWLDAYSSNKSSVLLFSLHDIYMGNEEYKANGTPVFKAMHFYLIPTGESGINLHDIKPEEANIVTGDTIEEQQKKYYRGRVDYDALAEDNDTLVNVRPLYQYQGYPAPNMDIAFASQKQLEAIRNSESADLRWTVNGKLQGSSSALNTKIAVCAYVTSVSSDPTSYSASRILLAAKEGDRNETLTVPGQVTFTTRYLSIDAHKIHQQNSGNITVYNMGRNQNVINALAESFGVLHVENRTLQMDYEQATTLYFNDGRERRIARFVYRYDDPTSLFCDGNPEKELMVTYPVPDINTLFSNKTSEDFLQYLRNQIGKNFGSHLAILDRYITIESPNNVALNIPEVNKFLSWVVGDSTLRIYSNYVDFKAIPQIDLSEADILINSHENGYSEADYMSFFMSAEKYSGTLLHFNAETKIKTQKRVGIGIKDVYLTIEPGFYYIYATENGTSLKDLDKDALNANAGTARAPFKVNESDLDKYSVYIRRDGGVSSNYVGTGLQNSTGSLGAYFGKAEVE